MDAPDSINTSHLEEFKQDNLEGSAEMYASILSIFLSDAPQMVSAIEKFVAEGQPAEAKGPAHNLKSNSAALGAVNLSRISKEIEAAALDEKNDNLNSLVSELRLEFEKVKPFYESEMQKANS